VSDDQYDDAEERRRAEAELRRSIAAEKKAEREMLEKIKTGFYGCMGLVVLIFLFLMFFTGK
jgi:hypothetical protein